jgi:hypothetical protein
MAPVIGMFVAFGFATTSRLVESKSILREPTLGNLLSGLGQLLGYYVPVMVFSALPVGACGIVLGVVLIVLARRDRATLPLRTSAGAVIGGACWVALGVVFRAWDGYRDLIWIFIITGGLCAALVGRRWLAMRLGREGQPLFQNWSVDPAP